jgi:3-phosphoshikimate 1-carboxyvinyltransferase
MIVYPGKYQGKIRIPASKSDSQRAILAAGLGQGTSKLIGVGDSEDEQAMLENIKHLGAEVSKLQENIEVKGTRNIPEYLNLNLGESGLGSRLLTSLLLVQTGKYDLNGEGSLLTRPFTFFKDNFQGKVPFYAATNDSLPIQLEGGFPGGELHVSGKQSSQYISGLLMALPLAKNDSHVFVEELNSKPYVQMTLTTLAQFGIEIQNNNLKEFIIPGNQKYLPNTYTVEGDWSSASYWLVASALGQKIKTFGLSMRSLQADKSILQAFTAANCTVHFSDDGIYIDGRNRQPFVFNATDAPDLFPALASFAALTEGESKIFGLSRLIYKESNRGEIIKSEFAKLGVTITLNHANDCMEIQGKTNVYGGRVFSNNDHRIAMCLAILGLFSDNPIEMENPESVKKSYPRFWEDLDGLKMVE